MTVNSAPTLDLPAYGEVQTGDPWLDLLGNLYLQTCALDEAWDPAWGTSEAGAYLADASRALCAAISYLPAEQYEQLAAALSEAAPEWAIQR